MNRKCLMLLSMIFVLMSMYCIPVQAFSLEDDEVFLNHFVWEHGSDGEKDSIDLSFVITKQFSSDEPDKKEYFEFLINSPKDDTPMPDQSNVSGYKIEYHLHLLHLLYEIVKGHLPFVVTVGVLFNFLFGKYNINPIHFYRSIQDYTVLSIDVQFHDKLHE